MSIPSLCWRFLSLSQDKPGILVHYSLIVVLRVLLFIFETCIMMSRVDNAGGSHFPKMLREKTYAKGY